MAQRVLMQAMMEDGTIIRDEARTFEDFTALALGFRRDPDVARLTWTVLLEPSAPPEPVLYDHSGQCPWNQSSSLDFEPAEADYPWWLPVA
jgi:hypothetical protein